MRKVLTTFYFLRSSLEYPRGEAGNNPGLPAQSNVSLSFHSMHAELQRAMYPAFASLYHNELYPLLFHKRDVLLLRYWLSHRHSGRTGREGMPIYTIHEFQLCDSGAYKVWRHRNTRRHLLPDHQHCAQKLLWLDERSRCRCLEQSVEKPSTSVSSTSLARSRISPKGRVC